MFLNIKNFYGIPIVRGSSEENTHEHLNEISLFSHENDDIYFL